MQRLYEAGEIRMDYSRRMTASGLAFLLEQNGAMCRAEAARRAGVSSSAVGKWVKTGKLPAARWDGGDMIIILERDLEKFLMEHPPMLQKRNHRAAAWGDDDADKF